MLLPSDLFEEGFEKALLARVLEQEVKEALRVALAEVAPWQAVAALGKEVDVQRAVLGEEGQRVQRGLGLQLRAVSSSV